VLIHTPQAARFYAFRALRALIIALSVYPAVNLPGFPTASTSVIEAILVSFNSLY